MALYAFDGTWDHKSNNTNVQKFYETYNRNFPKPLNLYVTGVGTHVSLLGRVAGGLFCAGDASTSAGSADRVHNASAR